MGGPVDNVAGLDGQDPDFLGGRAHRVDQAVLAVAQAPEALGGPAQRLSDEQRSLREALLRGIHDRGDRDGWNLRQIAADLRMPQDPENTRA